MVTGARPICGNLKVRGTLTLMATSISSASLTLEEFRQRYAHSEKPYEFWYGEAIEKSVPTWLHSFLQIILGKIFLGLGYNAASELELRIDPQFQPRPDLVATRRAVTARYPTKAEEIEIVVEILSPEDALARVYAKCEEYARIGIKQIFIADPESETGWVWNAERRQLDRVDSWTLTNGRTILLPDLWRRLHETPEIHS